MRKIFIAIITTPIIYLIVAITLVHFPFERTSPEKGLDFDVIETEAFLADNIEETGYLSRDKTELFYRYIQGHSDISIVLLHGSGSEGRYLIPLAHKLNSLLDISVVIPDLRGHGRSMGQQPGDVHYLGQFEHDLEDLLLHLKSSKPDNVFLLGGHSSGGGLVVKHGGNSLAQFNGAILLAPYLGYQAPTVRPNSGGWVQVVVPRYIGLAMLNNVGITYFNNTPVLFFNRPAGVMDHLQVDSYSYRLNESFAPVSYAADLSANKNPILLLVGKEDEAFYAQAYKDVMNSYAPHTELYILENVKHLDITSNEKAVSLIVQWIEKTYHK
ncbi:alpha/beta hydrolase [Shewanella gelidii]|uniref:Alpha/beta hydrolase n=1 Tax=Shewanella gelidii TaxID=1642821 RepID=A0A917JJ95_9GAMM|nr:alpha/beta hydrolase [Shewanella gelidii]MCL1096397.1 alpha/beta fold hydrolase [Shewanella gelidii]GGI67174.1 alpha/beta hydrolase [Shewanella gelidii]